MEEEILSLGSIVYLKNNHNKLMVISRGAIYNKEGEESYFDYLACNYPRGLENDRAVFFNNEDIDQILYYGYNDEEDQRIKKLYLDWRSATSMKKGSNQD